MYSQKVRHLIVDEKSSTLSRVHYDISLGRTQLYLFPNLKFLTVTVTPFTAQHILLYMHNDLRHISVLLKTEDFVPSLAPLLTNVGERLQNLESFTFSASISARMFEAALDALFKRQHNLRRITLPLYTNTSAVLSSLALLPRLENVLKGGQSF